MKTIKGNCSCNAVQYSFNNDVKCVLNCHCTSCRKLTGAAFTTYLAVLSDDYTIIQGKENLTAYDKANTTIRKHFCKNCGTPLFNTNPKYGDVKIIYLGTLEEGTNLKPQMNIYCSTQLDWLKDLSDLPNMEAPAV